MGYLGHWIGRKILLPEPHALGVLHSLQAMGQAAILPLPQHDSVERRYPTDLGVRPNLEPLEGVASSRGLGL